MEITLLIMENHGIVFLNFCGNPDNGTKEDFQLFSDQLERIRNHILVKKKPPCTHPRERYPLAQQTHQIGHNIMVVSGKNVD